MQCYRISKYNPIYRTPDGAYIKKDWTSFSDIGNSFNGVKLNLNEYNKIENEYLKAILSIMDFYGVCEFKIEELEMRADICEISEYLLSKGVLLEKKDKIILDNVNKWSKVKKEYFSNFFKLIMKECFWCVLYNDKMIIKFGYDFYVYVFCEYILNNALEYLNKIFIEKLV